MRVEIFAILHYCIARASNYLYLLLKVLIIVLKTRIRDKTHDVDRHMTHRAVYTIAKCNVHTAMSLMSTKEYTTATAWP